jgi:hypothetical protein
MEVAMRVEISWYNVEQTILHWRFEKGWGWEDYYEALHQSEDMMDVCAASQIDVIADMRGANLLPGDVLSHFRRFAHFHPKTGNVVVVGGNMFMETVLGVFARFQPTQAQRIHLAPSIEIAEQRLREARYGVGAA